MEWNDSSNAFGCSRHRLIHMIEVRGSMNVKLSKKEENEDMGVGDTTWEGPLMLLNREVKMEEEESTLATTDPIPGAWLACPCTTSCTFCCR